MFGRSLVIVGLAEGIAIYGLVDRDHPDRTGMSGSPPSAAGRELAGYALAGVEVVDARDPEAVRRAWDEPGRRRRVVLLTAEARRSLAGSASSRRTGSGR